LPSRVIIREEHAVDEQIGERVSTLETDVAVIQSNYVRKDEFVELRSEVAVGFARTDAKIDHLRVELHGKMDAGFAGLNGKIDAASAELNGKIGATSAEMNGKIDARYNELNGKIDAHYNELSGKIDTRYNELNGKIGAVSAELNAKIDAGLLRLDAKIDRATATLLRWMFASQFSVAALVLAAVKYL
jgi:hypothetical protein